MKTIRIRSDDKNKPFVTVEELEAYLSEWSIHLVCSGRSEASRAVKWIIEDIKDAVKDRGK